ncbi:hypothetical protein GCM10009117_26880 [Gangjinia marincola]|uniref:Rhomboid family intramembrane serine protease n=1 Tax=Gangjinia marincola TaxID=578463 RepID=A0ABP3XVX1_9FLAO
MPYDPKISWEGHLSGLLSGILLAIFIRDRIEFAKKYAWELESYDETKDPFMRHFDEDGNFVEWEEE